MRRVVFRVLVCPVFLMILFGTDAIAGYYDRSYALVIGINKYPSPKWNDLDYARGDAEAVASFLDSQGFEVIPLYDRQATKTAIIKRMQNVLARKVGKDDRVLVFFAGLFAENVYTAIGVNLDSDVLVFHGTRVGDHRFICIKLLILRLYNVRTIAKTR